LSRLFWAYFSISAFYNSGRLYLWDYIFTSLCCIVNPLFLCFFFWHQAFCGLWISACLNHEFRLDFVCNEFSVIFSLFLNLLSCSTSFKLLINEPVHLSGCENNLKSTTSSRR
jgi:hypothetical protein